MNMLLLKKKKKKMGVLCIVMNYLYGVSQSPEPF